MDDRTGPYRLYCTGDSLGFIGRVTRAGRAFFGLPVEPRTSRGFRRHIRKMKARGEGYEART